MSVNLLDTTRKMRVAMRRGLQWAAVPQARALGRRGIPFDRFREFNLRWLRDFQIRSIVDVGANEGDFSAVLHEVLPDARIVACEPLAACCTRMKARLSHVAKLEII